MARFFMRTITTTEQTLLDGDGNRRGGNIHNFLNPTGAAVPRVYLGVNGVPIVSSPLAAIVAFDELDGGTSYNLYTGESANKAQINAKTDSGTAVVSVYEF